MRGGASARATGDGVNITTGWQDNFKSQMTRVSFSLSLTRPMLEFLCASADNVRWDRRAFGNLHYPDNWFATEHALMKRGLIERKPPHLVENKKFSEPPWRLTPAGLALIELLKIGGLYIEAEEAKQRFLDRPGRK
jgi:hypothetical protein